MTEHILEIQLCVTFSESDKVTEYHYRWWGLIFIHLDAINATAMVAITNQNAKFRNASSSGNMSRKAGNQE